MSDVDDALARSAYSVGYDPLDWAINLTAMAIEARDVVYAARKKNPQAFPLYVLDDEPETVARAIIGRLLDAGWTPPNPPAEAGTRHQEGPA